LPTQILQNNVFNRNNFGRNHYRTIEVEITGKRCLVASEWEEGQRNWDWNIDANLVQMQ